MKAKYLALLAALSVTSAVQAADALTIDVHRDANCGCCKKWISHLEANGFKVVDHVESNMTAVKQRLGVAPRLASCHTAVIDGKFVEGHVPAAQVIELTKRDDLLGIAVPGMPAGSTKTQRPLERPMTGSESGIVGRKPIQSPPAARGPRATWPMPPSAIDRHRANCRTGPTEDFGVS